MAYIKKLVMQGFKSFVRKTEIPFTSDINVILGPNGSGKSNITDALCFVLGRLSIKSMRAAKAKNLIFLGTKSLPPAKEAIVEIVFDNSDNAFSFDKSEISIKRIVRKNGLSIYKINDEPKTRQEVLTLLSQAGVDPNGFNIILQGEIQNFVRMHTEERRKVIEEVSGISIYESRKEKSLSELDKTENKLKEILSILRERHTYLANLEKEREQALRFKKLESDVKQLKASITYHDLTRKNKEIEEVNSEISKKIKETEKLKGFINETNSSIKNIESEIATINSTIQKSTGLEQEMLNKEIVEIRAELAVLNVKLENYEKKISEISKQKQEIKESIKNNEKSVQELQKGPQTTTKKEKEILIKKQELEKLEEQRKKFYALRSELKLIKDRTQDKNSLLQSYNNESEFLIRHIEATSKELFDKKHDPAKLELLRNSLSENKLMLENLIKRENELEKISYNNKFEIDKQNNLIDRVSKMEICPLCKNKITPDHVHSIKGDSGSRIISLKKEIEDVENELKDIQKKKELLNKEINSAIDEIKKRESDSVKFANIDEKKRQIKNLQEKIEKTKEELVILEKTRKKFEINFDETSNVEQKYDTLRLEVQEISLRSDKNIDSEVSFKQRELERLKISFNQFLREEETISEEIILVKESLKEKEKTFEEKKKQEEILIKKFEKLISERDLLQKKIRENENLLPQKQSMVYSLEQGVNNLKIDKARLEAESKNFEIEMLDFSNIEIIKSNKEILVQRLSKAQEALSGISTSVNLRSIEVYDSIKKEYESVREKAEIIAKEKESVLKIIQEIDIKKKKTFLRTLNSLNEIFSRNFSELSQKGQVLLELENTKDPFEGGVSITVKTGHGKYFDVTSLSGGEQTIVALSLIFAIQELNPYCFYILDEIDAALDKRNSERLAVLLKKYMKKGQYIVISHNDEVISNASILYGISMHEGVSKVVSLKI